MPGRARYMRATVPFALAPLDAISLPIEVFCRLQSSFPDRRVGSLFRKRAIPGRELSQFLRIFQVTLPEVLSSQKRRNFRLRSEDRPVCEHLEGFRISDAGSPCVAQMRAIGPALGRALC